MIILTAGHTGPNTGAQCATTQFDEGAENIWLRDRIAEILTNKYGLLVLVDNDKASLKLLIKSLTEDMSLTELTELTEDADASPALKSVEIPRATSCEARERIEKKENWNKREQSQACLDYAECRQFLERSEKRKESEQSVLSVGNKTSRSDKNSVNQRSLSQRRTNGHARREVKNSVHSVRNEKNSVSYKDILIDLHFNAHTNPQARGTETIVADDATTLELKWAVRMAHVTADALGIPLRSIKTESETPHRRLAMLHLTPQSIILEVCFCTSPEDVKAYREHREQLAEALAHNIAQLLH